MNIALDRYGVREDCRLCKKRPLMRLLELPATPLANEFPLAPCNDQEFFPLWLSACVNCGHVQLPVVVDPERLFREYVYVSGTSPVFIDHFRHYADSLLGMGDHVGELVVEIGSNDGTLLKFFKDAKMRVLGIDPARAIAERATASGIETWPEFFNEEVSWRIIREHGQAKFVVANNVFAHADDLEGIVKAVHPLLDKGGLFVFEVSYLVDVLKHTLFDTIYHEHLSYHAVEPLVGFFRRLGMSVVSARRVNTHGGSIRVAVSPELDAPLGISAANLIVEERALGLGTDPIAVFDTFGKTIATRREELLHAIRAVKLRGGTVAAYGAPAKATTLLHTFGATEHIDFVIDDSPHKQGRWMPGGKIPVFSSAALDDPTERPDCIVVLAWNFAESILKKLASYRASGGVCIVPLPTLQLYGEQ